MKWTICPYVDKLSEVKYLKILNGNKIKIKFQEKTHNFFFLQTLRSELFYITEKKETFVSGSGGFTLHVSEKIPLLLSEMG